MADNYSEFQIDNWVIYLPEGNYCTVKSLSSNLILEGVFQDYLCPLDYIGKIKITEDKLQVCGFDIGHPIHIKVFNSEIYVAVFWSDTGIHTLYNIDKEFCKVQYVHEVQNAYYQITGELLKGNLYGVREG